MSFLEFLVALALAIAGGAAGAAIINGINERWKFKASREAAKEDKEEEKEDRTEEVEKKQREADGRLKDIEDVLAAQSDALKLILLDRVLYLGKGYVKDGEISFDDRRRFHAMHDCYHTGLHGNGDADLIVEAVDELPLKR